MTSSTLPRTVRYWRREAKSSPHRDWHTAYALASWTAQVTPKENR